MAALSYLDAWIAELEAAGVSSGPPPASSRGVDEILADLAAGPAAGPAKPAGGGGANAGKKKEKKDKKDGAATRESKKKNDGSTPAIEGEPHAGHLEFRVGKIVEAWPHPDSDKLYCEKIDIGEPELRVRIFRIQN